MMRMMVGWLSLIFSFLSAFLQFRYILFYFFILASFCMLEIGEESNRSEWQIFRRVKMFSNCWQFHLRAFTVAWCVFVRHCQLVMASCVFVSYSNFIVENDISTRIHWSNVECVLTFSRKRRKIRINMCTSPKSIGFYVQYRLFR